MRGKFKNAIITGGSSGIGKAIAAILVAQKINVTIIARTNETLQDATDQLERQRQRPDQIIHKIAADVSECEACTNAINSAVETMGGVDLLITSAGIAKPGYFKSLPIPVFEKTMQVNYFGSLYSVKAVLPTMENQKFGHIVLISSGAGLTGVFGYTPYSPTKFAVRGFAEALRAELKPSGVRVSVAYPPDTDTPQLHAESRTKPDETKAITGMARCWKEDDVARVIVNGVMKNTFAITPGIEMTLLNLCNSVLAGPLHAYFDRIVRRVQERKQSTK